MKCSALTYYSALQDTVMLGADFYETDAEVAAQVAEGKVPIGIGENTKIKYHDAPNLSIIFVRSSFHIFFERTRALVSMLGVFARTCNTKEPESSCDHYALSPST